MRSVLPITAAGQATAALVAAFLMYPAPAAAHRICGDTPVEVNVQVRERRHGESVAFALWSNCARSNYGDHWGSVGLARSKGRVFCYDVSARRSYYSNQGIITCDGGYIRYPRWVCFYRATPCRYRANNDDD
jgi:hypothetical protein